MDQQSFFRIAGTQDSASPRIDHTAGARHRRKRNRQLLFESLEVRQLLTSYTWAGGAGGGSWVGTNAWKVTGSTPAVYGTPGSGDTVTISGLNAGASITLDTAGTISILGLTLATNNAQNNILAQGTGSGGLTIGTSGVTTSGNQSKGISADIVLGAAQTWNIGNTNGLSVSGVVSGGVGSSSTALTKTGAQLLTYSGNNTYTGQTSVSAGTLRAGHANALGSSGTGHETIVGTSGTLSFGAANIPEDVSVGGALTTFSASSLLGTLTLTVSNVNINTQSGTLTLAGKVTESGVSGGITKQGLGNLVLSNNTNDYSGDTVVASGSSNTGIQLGADNVIPNGAGKGDVLVNTGFFDLNGHNETINGLTSTSAVTTGIVTNSATGTWTLTVGDDNTTASFAGKLTNSSNKPLALKKIGSGTQTISNTNNDYQGDTTVDGGILKLGASQVIPHGANKGNVVLGTNGQLDLSGFAETINGLSGTGAVINSSSTQTLTITSGSTVAPGTTSTTGILSTVDILYASSTASVFDVDLNNATPGSGYDQLKVTGTVNLGSGTSSPGSGTNLNVSVGSNVYAGEKYIIIDNDSTDAVTGIFAGLLEGSTFTVSSHTFRITYRGGYSGNDVVLECLTDPTSPLQLPERQAPIGDAGPYTNEVCPMPSPDVSAGPTRYGNGAVEFSLSNLSSAGFGQSWGQGLSWSNMGQFTPTNRNGSGFSVLEWPSLLSENNDQTIMVLLSGGDQRWFDLVSSVYQPDFYVKDTLTHDAGNDEFIWTDIAGNVIRFNDFDSSLPAGQRGLFKSFTDPFGTVTEVVSYTPGGAIEEVQRSATDGSDTITESYLYTYVASGANLGLLASAILRRQVNSGSWNTVRSVDYTYYDGVEAYGSVGDLKTSVVKDAGGQTIDTSYFRYYTAGEADGYAHGLKSFFGTESFSRLSDAFANPFTATDSQAAGYADSFFEYDSLRRVTLATVQGAGCSVCSAGQGTYTYSYTTSSNSDAFNSWKVKTVEGLPDGNQNTVYTNFAGQAMLSIFEDTATSDEWITFYEYDGNGRMVLMANPSAVTGYNDTYADLLNDVSGNYQYLADSAGLITLTDFYSSTTATSTTSGGVAGYYQNTKLQQGETGTPVLQNTVDYISRTDGLTTVYMTANSTVYRNDNGTGTQTTSYDYTWFTGTTQIESVTTTLPVISSGQNGPGVADESTTFNDTFGRPIWTRDGDGFLTYTEYDQATGAVSMMIQDVETAPPASFPTLPSGWATPVGGGLNLITTYDVDSLGRITQTMDANGNVTFNVYDDANHETRTYRGFTWDPLANSGAGAYVQMTDPPPTMVYREDRAGSYTETLTISATPTVDGNGVPTGAESFTISDIQTLSRQYTNDAGQMVTSDAYFDFTGMSYSTAANIGTQDVNFYRTQYAYDQRGRQNRVENAVGTITRTVYDGLGREVSQWIGTDDVPTSGFWSPTNNAGANMVQVSANEYDNSGVGDGNLTRSTALPDASATQDRVTDYFYDWRNRTVAIKSGVLLDSNGDPDPTNETDGVHRPIAYTVFDNLSQTTQSLLFDGDGVTIVDSNSDGVPDQPSAGLLRAKSTNDFDDQGRVYGSSVFSVDPSSGTVSSDALRSETFFDHRGLVVKTSQPGGLVQKAQHDGAGRTTKSFATDGGGDSTWADALDVSGDAVLEQTENEYDNNGNALLVTHRARFHDETTTGELGDPSNAPLARVSYVAMYFDNADRMTHSVNVGTNGGTAYTRPSTVPTRSDIELVTSYSFDASGFQSSVIDPQGIETRTAYDRLGRTTQTIQTYVDGTPSADDDLTTEYTYDGAGHILTLRAVLPGSTHQATEYVYGVTTGGGSDINSNDLLALVKYPDKTTGDPSTSSADQESFAYNALGQTKEKADRNGSVHGYSFDLLGRSTADAVTTLGSGVDGAVLRITTNYDTAGQVFQITSYDAASAGNVVNQVERHYNGLRQLTAEYQEHSGAVNVSTTPAVLYAYSEMAGGANHSRLTSMTYPDGRIIRFEYGAGLDDDISRLSFLADDNSGSVGTRLEELSYLGLGTVIQRSHPEPGVDLTYIKQGSEPDGDAGDKYTGLDRFGRIVDQRWIETAGGTDVDRYRYGYDRDSNRLYRENVVDAAFSEIYHGGGGYDLLNRLNYFARGTLNGTKDQIATPTRSQEWDLDALGNWGSLTNDGGAPETRDHNAQNQVTQVGSDNLTFDNNGNTTVDEQGRLLSYDAWNRLVTVETAGNVLIAQYAYDGNNWRITENSGTARELFYSNNWQVVEERESGIAIVQNVWSPVYIDAMILRDRDADSNSGNGLEERLYSLHDANFNVSGIVDQTGQVAERYIQDPYGSVEFLDANFSPLSPNDSAVAWQYIHQGGRLDLATLLYNFRNRDYSSALGRWLQVDPIGYADTTNAYGFCITNPYNRRDPFGLTSIATVLEVYFSAFDLEILWIMPENDEYTTIVRRWEPVREVIDLAVRDLAKNCGKWDLTHRSTSNWRPGTTDPPQGDPRAWRKWKSDPPGTDPTTAGLHYNIYRSTHYATESLHTSAIGSFVLFVTVDEIDCCNDRATLNVWMGNVMSQKSFGMSVFYPFSAQAKQYMWWNWKEEVAWEKPRQELGAIHALAPGW